MNVGDYGVQVLFNTAFDMSAETGLTLTFTKPDGTTLVKTGASVQLGLVNVSTPLGEFLANQYVTYTTIAGDIDQSGQWFARVTYDDPSPLHLTSGSAQFQVGQ